MEDSREIGSSLRVAPPIHYVLKIESFSQLSEILRKTNVKRYESGEFEVGGYKWKLLLFPCGNEAEKEEAHISLYLAISNINSLPPRWEINAKFTFFIYDQIRDKFLTVYDGRMRRFHPLKTEWGFTQFLPLSVFNEISSGYLVDDCCSFGVEVFVNMGMGKVETLQILTEPKEKIFTWKIKGFTAKFDVLFSDVFTRYHHQWKLLVYPKGDSRAKGEELSLFLCLENCSSLQGRKLYAEFKLCVKNQLNDNHQVKEAYNWFCASCTDWSWSDFMSLEHLRDSSKGFIENDTLIVEVNIRRVCVTKISL
ncbi:MATH domain-containing protein [Cephalotus follicularis]|uniref:MATH domain-containing protein n=1 Tax=Cephalotus follicularis TaxID=3775 RepID=A0A1Q3AZJ4_CEPFO|nr:MATH domain-containing protein [Cephalotus follicularis]